ncbi:hypothetical protein ACMXYX_11230 [Neptuniibacter sp. QD72_48]|uniref:hypothetical protein n=1 Tax=unclassified Neptuniibacter TaxID=2630693 RepID=UPI0039F66226
MSIFITSLGATDNEICAPFTQAILNTLDNKGFSFCGLPAVEAEILISSNQVNFTLHTCKIKTQPITFKFGEVHDFTRQYRIEHRVNTEILSKVEDLLLELEDLASHCTAKSHCSNCVVKNRGPNPNKLAFNH